MAVIKVLKLCHENRDFWLNREKHIVALASATGFCSSSGPSGPRTRIFWPLSGPSGPRVAVSFVFRPFDFWATLPRALASALISHLTSDPISGKRERMSGELIPVRVELSRTKGDDVQNNGPENAIDMDLETLSISKPNSDGKIWFKIIFGQVHCVQQVVRFGKHGNIGQTWHCTKNGCNDCEGSTCSSTLTITVITEGLGHDPEFSMKSTNKISGNCGDTVKLERTPELAHQNKINLYEIVVIGTQIGKENFVKAF